MNAETREKAATALLEAYDRRVPLPPLSAGMPDLSVSDAYAIQLAQVTAWTAAGAVSVTFAASQERQTS